MDSCERGCGLFGECSVDICICKVGWQNSFDSQFALSPKEFLNDDDKFFTLPCVDNRTVVTTLYAIHALLAAVAFILTLLAIKRVSQFRRSVTPLITIASIFALGVYKCLKRERENVLASDIFIGVLTAIIGSGSSLSMLLFMNKYIVFRIKVQSDAEEKTRLQLRIIEKFIVCVIMLTFLVLGVVVRDISLRNILFKIGLGFAATTMCWLLYETSVQFNFLLNQLKKVREELLATKKKMKLMKLLKAIKLIIMMNSCAVLASLLTAIIRVELLRWTFHVILFSIYATSVGMNVLFRKVKALNKSSVKKRLSSLQEAQKPLYDVDVH